MDACQERFLASSFSSSVDRYFGGSLSAPGLTRPLMRSTRDDLGMPYWKAAHLIFVRAGSCVIVAHSRHGTNVTTAIHLFLKGWMLPHQHRQQLFLCSLTAA